MRNLIREAFGNRLNLPYCTRSLNGQLLRASVIIAPFAIICAIAMHIVGQHEFGNAVCMSWLPLVPLVALSVDIG